MDELVQKLIELGIGNSHNESKHIKGIVADAVSACLGLDTIPVVSSRHIGIALTQLQQRKVITAHMRMPSLDNPSYTSPTGNQHLRPNLWFQGIALGEAIRGTVNRQHPDLETVVHYTLTDDKAKTSGHAIVIYFREEQIMQAYISSKLSEGEREGHYLFEADTLVK